jgi:hypothetical protein
MTCCFRSPSRCGSRLRRASRRSERWRAVPSVYPLWYRVIASASFAFVQGGYRNAWETDGFSAV